MPRNNDFHDLENHLAGLLQGIRPQETFVRQVKKRFREPGVELHTPPATQATRFAIISGGILSGFLLLLMLARLFFYLSGLSKRQTA